MIEFKEMQLKDAVDFQPSIGLKKGEEYPFIEMAEVDGISKIIIAPYKKLFDGTGGAKFAPNDILFARIEPCLDNKKICKVVETGFGSTEFFVLRAKQNIASQDYIFYFVKTHYVVQSAINSYVGASGRQRADLGFVKNLKISLPPLPIQQKIASILSAYDELIENNQQRIKLLEQMAEEIYKEWFVRLRFPGYETSKIIDGLPEGWEWKKVETIFKTSSGGTPSRLKESEYYNGTIDWIKTGELKDSFIHNSEETITEVGLKNSSAKLFPAKTLLMAMYGVNIGQLGISTKPSSANQAVCVFTPLNEKHYSLCYTFFFFKSIRSHLFNISMGAAQQNLSQELINNINFLTPSAKHLIEYDTLVKPMFEEIKILQQKNQLLQETRDLLLPRLISGKLSVAHLVEPNTYTLQAANASLMAAEPDTVYSKK